MATLFKCFGLLLPFPIFGEQKNRTKNGSKRERQVFCFPIVSLRVCKPQAFTCKFFWMTQLRYLNSHGQKRQIRNQMAHLEWHWTVDTCTTFRSMTDLTYSEPKAAVGVSMHHDISNERWDGTIYHSRSGRLERLSLSSGRRIRFSQERDHKIQQMNVRCFDLINARPHAIYNEWYTE